MNGMNTAQGNEKRTDMYDSARFCLLAVVAFTLVNVILRVTGTDMYFLFSASVPLFLVDLGLLLSGRYPEEVYTGELAEMEFLDTGFFVAMLVAAIVLTALYLLCWLLSARRRVVFMIVALVLFTLDTLLFLFLYGISAGVLFDLAFHVIVLIYLVLGVRAYFKRRREEALGLALPLHKGYGDEE